MSISRRFFLRGTGATLALPLLPSLLSSREARAAETPRPCYVHYATPHGGIWADRMFPALPATGVQTRQYAGREVRRFDLQLRQSGGPVLGDDDLIADIVLRQRPQRQRDVV